MGLAPAALVSSASAAACSPTTPTASGASCTVSASLTVSGGTLGLVSSPNLFWAIVGSGFDQWASASATTLSGCTVSSGATSCSGGTRPVLEVVDATGSGNGWAVSEFLSSNTLPTGTRLVFNGAGSATIGNSTASPYTTNPFSATTPGTVCDFGSTCAQASAASSCSHAAIGFSTCPSYPVTLGGSSATAQVDLYSAAASSGEGAICFASGTATSSGCSGATPDDYYDLGVQGSVTSGTTGVVINMAVNSGP